jgi:pyroglutamyl-peptidase
VDLALKGKLLLTGFEPFGGEEKNPSEALIDEIQPAVVLSLGLATGRSEVSIEKVAVNYTSKGKDNAGVVPAERPIVSGAADAYFATIPAEQVVDDINKKGIPTRLSLSAGAGRRRK